MNEYSKFSRVLGVGEPLPNKEQSTPALGPGDFLRWRGGEGTVTAVELSAVPSRSLVRVKVDGGYSTPQEFAIPLTMALAHCEIFLRWDADAERRAEPKMSERTETSIELRNVGDAFAREWMREHPPTAFCFRLWINGRPYKSEEFTKDGLTFLRWVPAERSDEAAS